MCPAAKSRWRNGNCLPNQQARAERSLARQFRAEKSGAGLGCGVGVVENACVSSRRCTKRIGYEVGLERKIRLGGERNLCARRRNIATPMIKNPIRRGLGGERIFFPDRQRLAVQTGRDGSGPNGC